MQLRQHDHTCPLLTSRCNYSREMSYFYSKTHTIFYVIIVHDYSDCIICLRKVV